MPRWTVIGEVPTDAPLAVVNVNGATEGRGDKGLTDAATEVMNGDGWARVRDPNERHRLAGRIEDNEATASDIDDYVRGIGVAVDPSTASDRDWLPVEARVSDEGAVEEIRVRLG